MPDYYSVIATAVSRLPNKTDEARCAIYDRARTALQEALRDYEPPLLAKEQMALDEAIRPPASELIMGRKVHLPLCALCSEGPGTQVCA